MADKSVGELIAATSVTPTDLFVLEQNGTAKKLTGQILENWLVSFADGHGGIQSITKLSTSGLADTYRITLADTTVFDFVVTNGKGISSITKTTTSGLVDTYKITYNDGTSGTFTVTNGEKGDKGDTAYIWIKYASQEPTASSNSFGDVPDDWIGVYFGFSSEAPTDWQEYSWYKIKGDMGDTGAPATLVSSVVTYQVGNSGTIIPSGTWSTSIPTVAQGKYLWTREVTQFNTGDPITKYSVSRMGIDGLGSVVSVAGVSPDDNGNVPLTAENVDALPIAGGTMLGQIDMNGQTLSGLNAPTEDDEAVNWGSVKDLTKPKAGFIYPLASPVVPDGFLLCDGAAYSRTEYPELFNAIGTIYGEGDGSTTFHVPDLATRVPVGEGTGYALGATGGEEEHTLTVNEIPSHNHKVFLRYAEGSDASVYAYSTLGNSAASQAYSGTTISTGGGNPHNNMQPYTVVNYIIATGKGTGVSISDIILGAQAIPLGLEYGGTGATNVADARKNLGIEDRYNYIDNSDFTQFVAQAGIGGAHGTQAYAGDRWILDSGTVTGEANANGNGYSNITLNGTIRQIIADPPAVGSVGIEMVSGTAAISYADGEVTITSSGGVIKNVSLLENTYLADNFPKFQPKGYGAELAECQRYFVKLRAGITLNGYITGGAVSCVTTVDIQEMRVAPTITADCGFIIRTISGYSALSSSGTSYATPSRVVAYNYGGSVGITITFASTVGTNNTPTALQVGNGTGIMLSADL